MRFLIFVVLSVLISGYLAQNSNIAGIWRESRKGGDFYICTTSGNSSTASGLYSEFGLAVGTIETSNSKTVWSGSWYEGGLGDCLTGSFELEFAGNSFEGVFICNDNDTVEYRWEGDLVERRSNLTTVQCGSPIATTDSSSLVGKWSFNDTLGLGSVDFCVEDDDSEDFDDFDDSDSHTFDASYYRPSNYIPLGYDTGKTARSGTVGVGAFYRSNEDGALPGSSLWFINTDGNLANIWWAGHYEYLNFDESLNGEIHGYDVYSLVSGTSESDCTRFAPLAAEPYDYYPYEEELFYFLETSSASVLIGSVVLSLFVFVL